MKFFFVKKNAQKGAETLNASGAGTQEPDDRGRLGTHWTYGHWKQNKWKKKHSTEATMYANEPLTQFKFDGIWQRGDGLVRRVDRCFASFASSRLQQQKNPIVVVVVGVVEPVSRPVSFPDDSSCGHWRRQFDSTAARYRPK